MLDGLVPLPSVPTIGTATDGGTGTTVNVAFTPGGIAGSNYTALSTPGSITATGTSSPITVSGLTAGTAYTFKVKATNSIGDSGYSASSNSVTPVVPSYTLALTANTTQNWTVPNGVSKIGLIVIGAGGGGASGAGQYDPNPSYAGGGGGAGGALAFYDYAVTPGTTYLITVGTGGNGGTVNASTARSGNSGSASSFGNIANANGGSLAQYNPVVGGSYQGQNSAGGSGTINASPVTGSTTQTGGVGASMWGPGINPPLAAGSNTTVTISPTGGPFSANFGGGGGPGQYYASNSALTGGGSAFGGAGGLHGTNKNTTGNSGVNSGGNGTAGNGPGGGGGGGGGSGYNNVNGYFAPGSVGGAGASGRVLVYTQ